MRCLIISLITAVCVISIKLVEYILVLSRGGGGHSLIWAIRGRAAEQGMVFWPSLS